MVGEEVELLVADADAELAGAGGEGLVELGNGRGRDAGPTGATRWMHRRWVRRRQEPTCEPQRHEGTARTADCRDNGTAASCRPARGGQACATQGHCVILILGQEEA